MIRFLTFTIIILALLFNLGCENDSKEETPNTNDLGHADSSIIILKPEALASVGIQLEEVGYRTLQSEMEVPGTIQANEDRLTHVGPRISGRIVEVAVKLGDRVRKGQKLAVIDSVELGKAQSEYLAAKAKLLVAEKAYERAKTLLEGKVIGTGEFQRREGEFLTTKSDAQAAEDQLHLFGVTEQEIKKLDHEAALSSRVAIVSPLDGTVIERHVTMGEVVEPAKSILTIADLSTVWGIAEVPEKSISVIQKDTEAIVSVTALPSEKFNGKITYISDLLDAASRTAKVRVEIDNPSGKLKPEMFVSFKIPIGNKDKTLAVPLSSIQRDGSHSIVYVALTNNSFEKRIVKLGHESKGYQQVLEGIQAGEKIVAKGAFVLKSESMKGEMEEE